MRFTSDELAYLISKWGYHSDVRGPLAGRDRLVVTYNGHAFVVDIWNLGEDGRGDVLAFTAGVEMELQFWEMQAWAEKHIFARLQRDENGFAVLHYAVYIAGTSNEFLEASFGMWRSIYRDFLEQCRAKLQAQK